MIIVVVMYCKAYMCTECSLNFSVKSLSGESYKVRDPTFFPTVRSPMMTTSRYGFSPLMIASLAEAVPEEVRTYNLESTRSEERRVGKEGRSRWSWDR